MNAVSASAEDYASLPQRAEDASGAQKGQTSSGLDVSRHRLAPGTRVGDHLVVRGVLGEGGTAVVYEALHTRLGASVALKVVDVADEYMEGARARLLREAHVCASIEDSHIPRIYDVGELPDGTPYVVMERVSGRTLENVLLQGALPLDIAVQITDDLLLAVEAVERASVVHRDIKPPNIILQTSSEGTLRVRLMDFGVSKNVSSEREPTIKVNSMSNPALTQQGAIVGTPHYMAPEQIVGPSVDTRADLYAVGVVAYEMMSGRTAFEGETTGDVVAAVLHTRPLPLSRMRDVHPELEAWVERAMAPRRSERFRNAREMREALRDAWDEHQTFLAAAGQRRWARRARWVGAIGLVVLGVALPKPAGYDFSSLSARLGFGAEAAQATAVQPELKAATAGAGSLAAPSRSERALQQRTTAPAQHAVDAVPPRAIAPDAPKMDLVGKPAQLELPGDPAVPTSAPADQAAAPRLTAPAAEPEPAADAPAATVGVDEVAARPDVPASTVTAPEHKTATLAAHPQPRRATAGGRKRPFLNPDAPVGPTEAPAAPQGTITAEQRGMLMGDYVQELDKRLAPPAPERHSAPADKLPENPYGD
ncbi:MAG: Serine/threonine protein kinase PrkC, regulation of stationary phase [Myxococcaceae bacterium]|nr:Serine/threonine protein kinase PrkC, regulation of stationary phase [Myxococcaceae bacterium]